MDSQDKTVTAISLAVAQAKEALQRGQLQNYRALQGVNLQLSRGAPMASWGPMMKK
jgi:hypothetical protein